MTVWRTDLAGISAATAGTPFLIVWVWGWPAASLPPPAPVCRGASRHLRCSYGSCEAGSASCPDHPAVRTSRAAFCNGSSAVANLQQQSAATKAQPSGGGCDYSRLARRKRGPMRPTPPLCQQGVRGSSSLGSTYFPLSARLSALIGGLKSEHLQQQTAAVGLSHFVRFRFMLDHRVPVAA